MRGISYDIFALRKKTAIKILLKSLIWAFALFGVMFILLLVVLLGFLNTSPAAVKVPENAVLTVNFDKAYGEIKDDSLLSDVGNVGGVSFQELLTALDAASYDNRIKAVAGKIHVTELGLAQLQELYQAVQTLHLRGKATYIFAPGFGDFGGGTAAYSFATAFDEITMLPNSELGLTGISVEVPFARKLLNKFGITPEFYARYEYKSGMASFTDEKPSAAVSGNIREVVADLNVSLLKPIYDKRWNPQKKEKVLTLLDRAPFSAEYALEQGLVDRIEYEGDWLRRIEKAHDAKTIAIEDYVGGIYRLEGKKTIALIVLEGTIAQENSVMSAGEHEIIPGEILAQIEEISEDDTLAGVLVRINSPGGSYNASNEIWHALVKLKEDKKVPLYVSMGDYAASGGYFVALAGDRIFAADTTITGSIGVFGGKFVLEKLWKKIGVNWETFYAGENSGILSPNFSFNASQKKAFEASLDRVYSDFAKKVANARHLTDEAVDEVARGRIWTGSGALSVRLVDELGGLANALEALKRRAKIKDEEVFSLKIYPRPKTFQEKIAEVLNTAPWSRGRVSSEILGIDFKAWNVLKRLQHDAVLPPVVFEK